MKNTQDTQKVNLFDCFIAAGISDSSTDSSTNGSNPIFSVIKWQYPCEALKAIIREEDLLSFCYPDFDSIEPVNVERFSSDEFTFVITDEKGVRIFGYCRRLLPLLKGVRSRYDIGVRYPGCLCVLSRHQSCPQLFSHLLATAQASFMLGEGTQVEKILNRLYHVSPFPSPGESIIVEDVSWNFPLAFQIPTHNYAGNLDAPLMPLLQRLRLRSFCILLSALLCERRVIFLAQELGVLSLAVHGAMAALRPLRWQHVLVPVLPPRLLTYACAPFPFVLGVQACHLEALRKLPLEQVLFVDLDTGALESFGCAEDTTMPDICAFDNAPPSAFGLAKIAANASGERLNQAFTAVKSKLGNLDLQAKFEVTSPPTAQGQPEEGGTLVLQHLITEVKTIQQRVVGGGGMNAVRKAIGSVKYSSFFQGDLISEDDLQLHNALTVFYLYIFGNARDYTVQRPARPPSTEPTLHFDDTRFLESWSSKPEPPHLTRFVKEMAQSQMLEQHGLEQIALMRSCSLDSPPSVEHGLFSKVAFHLFARKVPFTMVNIRQAMQELNKENLPTAANLSQQNEEEGWLSDRSSSSTTGLDGPSPSPDSTQQSLTPTDEGENSQSKANSTLKIAGGWLPKNISVGLPSFVSNGSNNVLEAQMASALHPLALALTSGSNIKDVPSITNQLCQEAYTTAGFLSILRVVWARLQDCKGLRWRHSQYALSLLKKLLVCGPVGIWSDAVEHLSLIRPLIKFTSKVGDGSVVRSNAVDVVTLLLDLKLLQTQRAKACAPPLNSSDYRIPLNSLRDFTKLRQEVLNNQARLRGSHLRKLATENEGISVSPAIIIEPSVSNSNQEMSAVAKSMLEHSTPPNNETDLLGLDFIGSNDTPQPLTFDFQRLPPDTEGLLSFESDESTASLSLSRNQSSNPQNLAFGDASNSQTQFSFV